jgi:SagB-type dehydrogenase family enzyme
MRFTNVRTAVGAMGEAPQSMAEDYHCNSKVGRSASYDMGRPLSPTAAELAFARRAYCRTNFAAGTALAGMAEFNDSLSATLLQRKSALKIVHDDAWSVRDLAKLLSLTYGISRVERTGDVSQFRRPVPSAGALYPLELFVIAQDVEGLDGGLYHFDPFENRITQLRHRLATEALAEALPQPDIVGEANVILVIAGFLDRTRQKYGERGYRFMLLEAGHLAQNACLWATQESRAVCCIGGFIDDALNKLLGLNGATEFALYCVAFGKQA